MKLKDALLAQRVHELLGQMTALSGSPIRAVSQDGVVYLRGAVPGDSESHLAETLVAGVTGVRRVVNELEVKRPSRGRADVDAQGIYNDQLSLSAEQPLTDQEG